jgi:hypothetical protein
MARLRPHVMAERHLDAALLTLSVDSSHPLES